MAKTNKSSKKTFNFRENNLYFLGKISVEQKLCWTNPWTLVDAWTHQRVLEV